VSYVIVPRFALANAGVIIDAGGVREALGSPITLGVILGLVVGKPVGLLAHQEAQDLDDLVGYAAELGLDTRQFTDDLMSRHFAMRIARDVESADGSGVAGTPTFFINGKRQYGAYDIDSLTEALVSRRERSAIEGQPMRVFSIMSMAWSM
jgi:hypothetical protein